MVKDRYAVAFKISRFKAIMLYWIRVLFPLNIKYGKHGKKKNKQTKKLIKKNEPRNIKQETRDIM